MISKGLEINEEFRKALDLMENTSKNVFITGKAGTGKSTLLNYFKNMTKKNVIVLAPTGVAAVNIGGQTIHSFFGFKPDITVDKIKNLKSKKIKIYKELDAIIIDEISMVRADLLDCIDTFLRKYGKIKDVPFGGIQMIFFGDLYQLPPVVLKHEKNIFNVHYKSPYFFEAKVFKDFEMEFIELEKIYRQKDEKFIEILNTIRSNTINEKQIEVLNSLAKKDFKKDNKLVINLTTINKKAEDINNKYLKDLKNPIKTYIATITGNFDKSYFPAEAELKIATGAQVMLLNNDSKGRWINGTMGRVVKIINSKKYNCDIICVELKDGIIAEVTPYTWEIFEYKYNEEKKIIETETTGTFTQYPIRLAWAITIHKSQGKTFDNVIIDFSNGTFAHGQAYVAFSRCTSLDGIFLERPFKKADIIMDKKIVNFLTNYQYKLSEKNIPKDKKVEIIKNAIKNKNKIEIVYLKKNDEKTRRIIIPVETGMMEYIGKRFYGLKAYCYQKKQELIFRIDRILEIKVL
ncbi:MAG: AAA family ATPase [Candidatus Goldbacteria bacterium]|nr:AAA family ATPase [Candidatus Goldiibacteriota bacterium]